MAGHYTNNPNGIGGFKPGHAGNPGGKPASARETSIEARKFAIEAVHTLVRQMRHGETGAVRNAASIAILDRAVGKPAQNVDFTLQKKITELSADELSALEERLTGAVLATGLDQEPAQLSLLDDSALGPRVTLDDDVIDATPETPEPNGAG